MAARGKLRVLEGGRVAFWCPGCSEYHHVTVEGPRAWGFNGDYDKPTFTPSVLVTGIQRLTDDEYEKLRRGEDFPRRELRCHSFVRDGRIEFLGDCNHALAGQAVEMTLPPDALELANAEAP